MKIVIPVAGAGTRLRPLTHSNPKPLLPVAGREALAYIVDPLVPLDPEEIVFVVGYMGDEIAAWVKKNYNLPCHFVTQTELKGLGFAVRMALEQVDSGPVMIVLGDTLAKCDWSGLVNSEHSALGVMKVDDPRRFGVAETENGFITRLVEKPDEPQSDLALIGLYFIKDSHKLKEALDELIAAGITTKGEIQLTDALEAMISAGQKFTVFPVDAWYDCGKKDTLLETNARLLNEAGGRSDQPGSRIVEPVFIAPDAQISDSTIGPHVSISANAVIKGSVIENTIVESHATIENAHVKDSLIGRRAVIKGCRGVFNIGDDAQVISE